MTLTIDEGRQEVFVDKREVYLSYKEFGVLKMLMGSRDIVSRQELLNTVWSIKEIQKIDSRTVDQHISRIRRKLKAKFIITVPRRGYKFAS